MVFTQSDRQLEELEIKKQLIRLWREIRNKKD